MNGKNHLKNAMTDREAGFGLAYWAAELFVLPALLTALAGRLGLDDGQINFVYYCLNFGFCLLIFRAFLKKNLTQAGKTLWPFVLAVIAGFLAHQVWEFASQWLLGVFAPSFSNVNDGAIARMVSAHPILMGVGTVVLVPLAEECMFRGLLFGKLRTTSRAAGYWVSVLAFCAVHVMGYIGVYEPWVLLVCFAQYIPAGLILARAYEYSGSIFAPIVIHAAVNAVSILNLR